MFSILDAFLGKEINSYDFDALDESNLHIDFESRDSCLDIYLSLEKQILENECDVQRAINALQIVLKIIGHDKFKEGIYSNCQPLLKGLFFSSWIQCEDIEFLKLLLKFVINFIFFMDQNQSGESDQEVESSSLQSCHHCENCHRFSRQHLLRNFLKENEIGEIVFGIATKCHLILSYSCNGHLLALAWRLSSLMIGFIFSFECPTLQFRLGSFWFGQWKVEEYMKECGLPVVIEPDDVVDDDDETTQEETRNNKEQDFLSDACYLALYDQTVDDASGIDWVLKAIHGYIILIYKLDQQSDSQDVLDRIECCFLQWICSNSSSFSHSVSAVKRSYSVYSLTNDQKLLMYTVLIHCSLFEEHVSNFFIRKRSSVVFQENFDALCDDAFEIFHLMILMHFNQLADGTIDEKDFDLFETMRDLFRGLLHRVIARLNQNDISWITEQFIFLCADITRLQKVVTDSGNEEWSSKLHVKDIVGVTKVFARYDDFL